MTAHADPRLVIAVLERAAEMLNDGFVGAGVLPDAMLDLCLDGDVWLVALRAVYGPTIRPRPDSASEAFRATAARLRDHLLSVALLCGALAGALDILRPGPDGAPVVDTRIRELIALHNAGDQLAIAVLRDLVEERELAMERGAWAPVELRQRWIETGPHEHAWRKWHSGDAAAAKRECFIPGDVDWIRRCTCGVFEHEAERFGPHVQVIVDGERRTAFMSATVDDPDAAKPAVDISSLHAWYESRIGATVATGNE